MSAVSVLVWHSDRLGNWCLVLKRALSLVSMLLLSLLFPMTFPVPAFRESETKAEEDGNHND
jgi:hypothetical protein